MIKKLNKNKETSILNELFFPIEIKKFLSDYFRKKKLLIKGKPGQFVNIFSLGELNRILNENSFSLQYPDVRMVLNQNHIPSHEFIEECDFYVNDNNSKFKISPQRVNLYLKKGASLILSDAQEQSLSLQKFAYNIMHELKHPISISSFYTSKKTKTFRPHLDPFDIITLQIEGSKKWQIFEPKKEEEHTLSPFNERDEIDFNLSEEFTLDSGDLLYMPKHLWHTAEAVTEKSLSLAISIRSYTNQDVVMSIINNLLVPYLVDSDLEEEKIFSKELPLIIDKISSKENIDKLLLSFKRKLCMFSDALEVDTPEIKYIVDSLATKGKKNHFSNSYQNPFKL